MNFNGLCVWFTGLPCSGKTTLSRLLSKKLSEAGHKVVLLDGDVIRTSVSKGLGFSKEDRVTNVLRVGAMALEEVKKNAVVICALVSPYEEVRNKVADLIGKDRFTLVYLSTPISVCEKRDVKGMYAKARRGEIKAFTGIDDPYEPPVNPDLFFDTSKFSEEKIVSEIIDFLKLRGILASVFENPDTDNLISIVKEAGSRILEVYNTDFSVENKINGSPITMADSLSSDIIYKALKDVYPFTPVLSEESEGIPYEERKDWQYFWLVDPLDGTKEFIKRNEEFTVNLALIHKHKPIIGIIYAPLKNDLYFAVKGKGTFRIIDGGDIQYIKGNGRPNDKEGLRIVSSRSHTSEELEKYLEGVNIKERVSAGSSLKFCLVAEGKADLYPRFGVTMEWDTAAGQIIVEEAGGEVVDLYTQKPLRYNKETLKNPYFLARRRL